MRTLTLTGTDPSQFGEQHGEAFRDDIKAAVELRLRLTLERTDLGSASAVYELARYHLPLLERFDKALYDELRGIARGANLTDEAIVVLNHYTDLRDLGMADLKRARDEGCSAWFVADDNQRMLGQTWDMHGSATPYALLLKVPSARGEQVFFTITGCLGMTGMSSWGTALTINNLNSTDATMGVVWPAMVRACVKQENAKAMLRTAMEGKIGSGRHYIFADDTDAYAIETSGTIKREVFASTKGSKNNTAASWYHTNHCVNADIEERSRILPTSTTLQRFATLKDIDASARPRTARAMYDAFGKVSMPWDQAKPDDTATCGAIVMDIAHREVLACVGLPHETEPAVVRV